MAAFSITSKSEKFESFDVCTSTADVWNLTIWTVDQTKNYRQLHISAGTTLAPEDKGFIFFQ